MACLTLSLLTPFNATMMSLRWSSEYGVPLSVETTGMESQFGTTNTMSSIRPYKSYDIQH